MLSLLWQCKIPCNSTPLKYIKSIYHGPREYQNTQIETWDTYTVQIIKKNLICLHVKKSQNSK